MAAKKTASQAPTAAPSSPASITLSRPVIEPSTPIANILAALQKIQLAGGFASQEQYDRAALHLPGIRAMKKTIEAHYSKIKAPLAELTKTVRGMEAEDLKPWESGETLLTDFMKAWDRKKEEEARKERERIAQEAREKAERERQAELDAIERQKKAARSAEKKEALAEQAEQLAAAPIIPEYAEMPLHIAGTDATPARKNWKARVLDAEQVMARTATALVLRARGEEIRARILKEATELGFENPKELKSLAGAITIALLSFSEEPAPEPAKALRLHEPGLNDLARTLGDSGVSIPGLEFYDDKIYTTKRS